VSKVQVDGAGNVQHSGTLNVGGSVTVNSGVFIADASGNVTASGNLDVTGAGSFGGNLGAGGVLTISGTGTSAIGGNLNIAGTLSKTSGSFKIDHPLDPANKYLYHSFVESPDMKNVYDGSVALDEQGEAEVELPEWFEALNKDFRYQLTCMGGFAPVYIAEEISSNRFKIAGGQPGMKVFWQVTGIRQDAYANAHRIRVEEQKSQAERGHYLHPEVFGQPPEKGIQHTRGDSQDVGNVSGAAGAAAGTASRTGGG
jgi:hypothetical protein